MSSRGESLDGYHKDDRNQKETEEYQFHDFFYVRNSTKAVGFSTVLIGYCDYLGTRPKSNHRPIIVTGR